MRLNKCCSGLREYYNVRSEVFERSFKILMLVAILGIIISSARGQQVEPIPAFRLSRVSLYNFNPYTQTFSAIDVDGSIFVLSISSEWIARTNPLNLKAVFAMNSSHVLIQRGDSLELLGFDGASHQIYACQNLDVLKVYKSYVLLECNGSRQLLNINSRKIQQLKLGEKPLNTWEHVLLFDLRTFRLRMLTHEGWIDTPYVMHVDIAFGIEGRRGIYVLLSNGSLYLFNWADTSLKRLANVPLSPPVAIFQSRGLEYIVLQDGTLVNELGSKSNLPSGMAYIEAGDGLYVVTYDGQVYRQDLRSWEPRGPIAIIPGRPIGLLPAKRDEGELIMVIYEREKGILEGALLGFFDYKADAHIKETGIYALENFTVIIETTIGEGLSGEVLVSAGRLVMNKVNFESAYSRFTVPVRLETPGCYNVTVDIKARGYFPSKNLYAGTICVMPRPVRCELQATNEEVEEGAETVFKLYIFDPTSNEEITENVISKLSSIKIHHTYPSGKNESLSVFPNKDFKILLRDQGEHMIRVEIPKAGPYDSCVTNQVLISVKSAYNASTLAIATLASAASAAAVIFYLKERASVWRRVERAIASGKSCEQLIPGLSKIMPVETAVMACEFSNLYNCLNECIDALLASLQPLITSAPIQEASDHLRRSRGEIGKLRGIYLKDGPREVYTKLLSQREEIIQKIKVLEKQLEEENKKLELEFEKYKSYLDRLEIYRDRAKPGTYSKLKAEYESQCKSISDRKAKVDEAIRVVRNCVTLLTRSSL